MTHMFDAVAPRYDLINDLASLGQDRRWRRDVVEALDPQPGDIILDLAAGTGTSSSAIARSGATVIATDFSVAMVEVGHHQRPEVTYVVGDALRLPYADDCFDAVTISFGLRNVVDVAKALGELRRVVRPGGTLVICEFSTPLHLPVRRLYNRWLKSVIPRLSSVSPADTSAYIYLGESIRAWPDQHGLALMLQQAGWTDIAWRNLTGGIVALHRAARP